MNRILQLNGFYRYLYSNEHILQLFVKLARFMQRALKVPTSIVISALRTEVEINQSSQKRRRLSHVNLSMFLLGIFLKHANDA